MWSSVAANSSHFASLGISRSKPSTSHPASESGAAFLMHELALPTTEAKQWPDEIFVEPSRLATGIWGEREGDIAAAYCADTFPKIKTFSHEGQLYVNTGTATKTSNNE